jgi:hypothetical protein
LKKAKVILLGLVAIIIIGGLLFFAGPAPEVEEGVGPLQPVYIVLAALAGIILLAVFIINIKTIMRSAVAGFPSIIAVVVAGALVFILVYVSWPVEIEMKAELLRAVLIASLALVAFVGVIIRLIRGDVDLNVKLGISDIGITKLKTFIYRSAALGCLALVAIVVYFISGETNLFFIAWLFFTLQLGLLIFPLMLARIMIFG